MTKPSISKLILPALCLGAIGTIISPVSATDDSQERSNTISLSVTTQCSFVVTDDNLNNNYEATGANGDEATFTNNGIHNFNIACNQISGYTVKAYAEDLVNIEDSNHVVAFYNYDEYTPRVTNNSSVAIWSAEITSGGNANAIFGNDAEHMEIIKSSDTLSAPTGDPFSVQYHAYIGRTTVPGVYEGKAVYTISMNPYNPTTYMYTIAYHANGIEGTPATQYGEANIGEDATVTLSNDAPISTSGTFLGWDTNPAAAVVVYHPSDTITISESNPNINLYAVWDGYTMMANGATMQDMSALSCANAEKYSVSGKTYELVDSRDSHSYLVRKLEDGNCWMVQNLSLYAGTTITADDTDLNGTATENNTFINNWDGATSVAAGSSQWQDDKTVYQIYDGTYQANTKNTTVSEHNIPTANTGSYYPFIVATAGYDTAAGTDGDQAGNSSICPRGWKLPTGGSAGQFNALYTTGYSSNSANFQSAMNINDAYPGYCGASYCPNVASNSIYLRSSTIFSDTYGYLLSTNSASAHPAYYTNKYHGFSVRCVLSSTGS